MSVYARLLTAILPALTVPCQGQGATDRPYEVESGTIIMKRSTKNAAVTVETTDTTYFKDWGRLRATWSTSKTSSRYTSSPSVERKFTLLDGMNMTTVDLAKMTGIRMRNPMADMAARMTQPQAERMAAGMGHAMNTKLNEAGEERVAGQTCKVQEAVTEMGAMKVTSRICRWNNIVLKTTSSGGGSDILEEATSVTLGAVPGDRVAVPAGAKITEMPGRGRGR